MTNPIEKREQLKAQILESEQRKTKQQLAKRTAAEAALDRGENTHLARIRAKSESNEKSSEFGK